MSRGLVAFDFDHTIVDDNSDTAIVELVGKKNIPPEVRELQHQAGWTAFMQGVFDIAFEKEIEEQVIIDQVKKLPPVEGIPKLLNELHRLGNYDVIIISDSNTIFINSYLKHQGLDKCITKIFSNPAEFIDGHLKIKPYHDQDSCKLSTRNLCKGQILDDFIKNQHKKAVTYDKIIYVGDGVNDFCPILHLSNNDVACIRHNYKLQDIVMKARDGKSVDSTGKPYVIEAELVVWDTGDDILKMIKN